MNIPKVAIITRTKNRAILLKRALKSVLDQEFRDWMLVVVNDGGDPAEVEREIAVHADAWQDRCVVVHNPQSLGMEAASNRGIREVDSEYVVIHDDDDSWHPSFLSRCVAFLDGNPPRLATPVAGVISYSTRILERIEGDEVKITGREPFNTWMDSVSLFRLASSNTFPPISFLFRRAALDEIGGFREDLPVLGDWDFHLRFAARYEIGLVREELAYYHHRIADKDERYGNTVIAGLDRHLTYDALLRNEYLRQDLASGRVGLGLLVNASRSFENVHRQMYPLDLLIRGLRNNRLARWFHRRLR
ncbi:MAG: glycosyltransferase family 2 protein [Chromatiales bacterium]|jgi:glycosyltransferase involved in cell wall biosynthesis|nr:glycosyltransferase family 2 protein [Chromatiales bacterium]